jgi:xylan 1,4-beta-xylosidase
VNASEPDPSLFHDDDGRKWFMNMQWNHRGHGTGCDLTHDAFDSILLQEWSPQKGLHGPVKNIYAGTSRTDRGTASVQAQWLLLSDHR